MDLYATKTPSEREDEEAIRLVRPSPKKNPPRYDLRRKRVDIEPDADLESDRTVSGDPDLSLKKAAVHRVLSRSRDRRVPAWDRREKRRVSVSPETLAEGGRYEPYRGQGEPEEQGPVSEPNAPPETPSKAPTAPPKTPKDVAKEIAEAAPSPVAKKPDAARPSESVSDSVFFAKCPEARLHLLGAQDTEVQRVLLDLADPSSALGRKVQELESSRGIDQVDPGEAVPALAGKLPSSMTMKDVAEAARKVYPPRSLSEQEREEARQLLDDAPLDALLAVPSVANLHPREIRAIIQAHQQFSDRPPDADERKRMIQTIHRTGYHTDPRTVPAPDKGRDKNGRTRSFAELSDDEKAVAWDAHRARVLAQGAVAKAALEMDLAAKGIPAAVAMGISMIHLQPRRALGTKDLSSRAFDMAMASGIRLTPAQRRAIQKELGEDPRVQQIVVGVLQAADYEDARQRYLGADAPEAVSEFDPPKDIARSVVRAMRDLDDSTSQYPAGSAQRDTARLFRNKVLQRLKALKPEKYQQVLTEVEKHDVARFKRLDKGYSKALGQYRKTLKRYDKDVARATKEHEAAMAAWQAEAQRIMAEYERQGGPYRALFVPLPPAPELDLPPKPVEPVQPIEPVSLTPEEAKDLRRSLFREASKSSYAAERVMKRAVYHGVSPYLTRTRPYSGWTQVHQRDFSDTDHAVLVESARTWLVSDYLVHHYAGAPRDVQLRAALDLAIRTTDDGAYSVGVAPPLYEAMLRDLAGVGPGGTLLTIREARTSYAPMGASTGDRTMTMPKFAAEQANGLLTRLDKLARVIQTRHAKWGMPFETAKEIVNDLDRTADEIEVAAFGAGSFARRQAEVVLREPDEPYMQTFENPQQPHQVDVDEPYMAAYQDDDSSGVRRGKSETGQPLVP